MSVSTKYARCNTHRTSQHPDRSFQVLLGLVLVATLGLFGQCGPLHASVPYTHDNSTLEQIPMASDGKSTLDWATEYYKRDLNPLPVPLRKKAPAIPNWQGLIFRSKAKLRQYFGKESNIGLLNGEPSDNTFDVDLDDPIAVNLAPHFLPETGRIHGRASSRASHWWYRSEPLPKTMKFTDVNGKVILEIRSTGSQTVVPPSIHPSGEKIEWEKFGEPGALVRDDWQRIAHLAVCTLFALHWPDEGSRHDCALALGGFLLRLGVGEELAVKIVTLAAESAGDEELEDRRRCVEDTAQKIKEGEATTGASRLADLLKGDGEKVVKRLRKWLEPEIDNGKEAPKPADDASEEDEEVVLAKPRIDAGNRDLPDVTKQALDALTLANDPPFLFRHAGGVARLERDDEGAPILRPVTVDRMIHELARSADWYATTRKTMGPALPPPHVAKDILATPNPPFLVLVRIVACPIFARDGSLQTKPGYNPKTQTFLDLPTNFKLPELPEHPSPRDLQKACDLIREELLGDFPLVGAADLAHCFALLLQPFAREPIKGPTPLFLIEKAVPGTGGTLMASSLTYPSLGCVPSAMTEGRDEDEWRKRITAHLRNAPVVTFIDNLRATLDSAAFSSALTGTFWTDRILGKSEMIRIPIRTTWVATGNNPTLSSEIARRTVRIRLDANVERPWMRGQFRHPDLPGWVRDHRNELIRAALIIIKAWIDAGRPVPKNLPKLGMFESWREVMGGILAHAGIKGFLGNLSELYEEADLEGAAYRAFVGEWWRERSDKEVGVKDLLDIALRTEPPLDLGDAGIRSQQSRLGKTTLMRMRNQVYDGLRVTNTGTYQGAQKWKLVKI